MLRTENYPSKPLKGLKFPPTYEVTNQPAGVTVVGRRLETRDTKKQFVACSNGQCHHFCIHSWLQVLGDNRKRARWDLHVVLEKMCPELWEPHSFIAGGRPACLSSRGRRCFHGNQTHRSSEGTPFLSSKATCSANILGRVSIIIKA